MKLAALLFSLCVVPTLGFKAYSQETYPSKPIRLVVPQSPGSGGDIVGRMLAEHLSAELRQSVIVDNKAGANGIPAAVEVAKEKPDGYTIMLGLVSQLSFNRHLYKNVAYDGFTDFTYIAPVVETPYVLVASKASGFNSLAHVIEAAKKQPGKLNYASAGNGNMTHLSTALLASTVGISLTHVPYKGSAPALTSVMAGETELMTSVVSPALPQIHAGKVTPIAIVGSSRVIALPQVPTVAELGIRMPPVPGWYALVAPPNLDAKVRQRLAAAVESFAAKEPTSSKLSSLYLVRMKGTGDQLLARAKQESEVWGQFIKNNNIQPD